MVEVSPYADLQWNGPGAAKGYAATYIFLSLLEQRYGNKTLDTIVWYLTRGMVGSDRCNGLETFAVVQAVYDIDGLNVHNEEVKLKFARSG